MSIVKKRGSALGLRTKLVTLATSVVLSGTAAIMPIAAVADHTTAHTIEQLQAQIVALQAQLSALLGSTPTPAPAAGKCSFTRALEPGMSGDDVKCLQQYLNASGYQVAASGPGSPGNETMYYGSLTKAAVMKWQDGNGVAYGSYGGYFGPKSQDKYDMVVVVAPSPTPTPTPPGTPPPPPAVGSGLTVTAPAEQPSASLVPKSAARVPFVKAVLTASADGDVTVKSVTVERRGLADDAAFDGIILLDEDGTQIGNAKTLSSDHIVVLNQDFTVKAGTSKVVTVAANMPTSLTSQAGQVARLALTAVDAGSSAVNASLPIESNGMTMNDTLTIGSVTMSLGSLDPGSANTKNVGTKGYYLAAIKASIGSAEDVTFDHIRFNQAGSAAPSDLGNVVVKSGDTEYPATISADGKYYVAKFGDGLKVVKGGSIEFSIKADLNDGSARTVDMNILRKSDIVVKGNTFKYAILVGGGTAGAASAGTFSSDQEPFFNAYAATIDKGSVLVSNSSKVPAGNVAVDVSDQTIGAFVIDVKGEAVQVNSFTLNMTFSGTGTSTDVTGVKLFDENGGIVAGPKDPASGIVKWTDTWTAPVGEHHYYVKAKLDTTFVTNDTIRVSVDPDSNMTVKGTITGLVITPNPTSAVDANTQTVKAGSLKMSVATTPFAQNVVRGIGGYHFSTLVFDAGDSGEDVRVTSVKIRQTVSAAARADEVNACQLFDGATALNTGSDVINPSDPSSGTTNDLTFALTNNLIVPKGTVKNVDLKCNITSSAANGSTQAFGLNDATGSNVTGAVTAQSITESVTTGVGSIMTVKTAGSFTVVKDASTPTQTLVIAGKTDVPMLALKYHATDEDVRVDELTLQYSSTTASTSDFTKATLWDGATKVGEAVWAGTNTFATSTLTGFTVKKDSDKVLTVKVNLGSIDVTASSTAGRLLTMHYDGNSSSTGTGVSSGQKLGSGSSGSFAGDNFQIMKSIPKFEKVAVPSTSIPQTDAKLYRFSVAADAAGPIALYKFTFDVSSSTKSATTSNFKIYAYTDSGFSVQAYANNPIYTRAIECVGLSNLETDTNNCNTVSTGIGGAASSTEVVTFFAPVANVASTTEAIIIPAGGKYYFELRGDLTLKTSGDTGNSISVSLLGDAARPVRRSTATIGPIDYLARGFKNSGESFLASASEIASQSANNDFVWSAMSTTTTLTGATSTPDWTNGFLVPGLPSTNMDANTFTN